MFSISKVDHFPEITRQGRVSEELQQIVEALHNSADKGERFCIDNIESGNAYNSMQQRIRAQAKKLNLKVVIRFDASEQKLYFKATKDGSTTNTVKSSDLKSIKTANKVTAK